MAGTGRPNGGRDGGRMTRGIRFDLREFSGALGDLGMFLPLALGLIAVNGLNATAVFLSAGLLYIAAGLYFRLPMPVQPLKATSVVAIAIGATPGEIAATALLMGVLFLAVAGLGLDRRLARLFPRPVIRGIQLGLSVLLVKGGWDLVAVPAGNPAPALPGLPIPPGVWIGALVAGLLLLSGECRRFPSVPVAILGGVLLGLASADAGTIGSLRFGPLAAEASFPANVDYGTVIFSLLLPQVALTFANSIVATADTCRRYYGEEAVRVTTRSLSATLGIANFLSGLFGGMPMCHGSGGVTAHYRFGARTGGASLSIGLVFVLVGLSLGSSVSTAASLLPPAVLGVLLLYVGLQHARLLMDIAEKPMELGIALSIGVATLLTGSLGVAFALGIVLAFFLRGLSLFVPEPVPGDR